MAYTADNSDMSTQRIPPCIRLMVVNDQILAKTTNVETTQQEIKDTVIKTSKMKSGTLFIITCKGGSIGREGDHHEVLLDQEIGCSKDHATVIFLLDKFYLIDRGSKNGTFLNGQCLHKNKATEIGHGSKIRIGNTILKCHVHPGRETCLECEPGVIANNTELHDKSHVQHLSKSKKEKLRKKEMKRIQNKYGVHRQVTQEEMGLSKSYKNRAEDRRTEKGSDNPFEATQSSNLETAIDKSNKGFKMLAQMGWKEGEGLGTASNQGIIDPIKIESRKERAGLGCDSSTPSTWRNSDLRIRNRIELMQKTLERYEKIPNQVQNEDNNEADSTVDNKS